MGTDSWMRAVVWRNKECKDLVSALWDGKTPPLTTPVCQIPPQKGWHPPPYGLSTNGRQEAWLRVGPSTRQEEKPIINIHVFYD